MTTLADVTAPHEPNDADKLSALVTAYQDDETVNPVVLLVTAYGAGFALCGSHRIAAAREVYEAGTPVEDLGWIVVSVADLLARPLRHDTRADVEAVVAGRFRGAWDTLCGELLPHLPAAARSALADQT